MSSLKKKSVLLAIGFNFVFPGLGYMYMGRWFLGVVVPVFIVSICLTIFANFPWGWAVCGFFYFGCVFAMVLDMIILNNKRVEKFEKESMMKCPNCAELINRDAKICRYCRSSLELQVAMEAKL